MSRKGIKPLWLWCLIAKIKYYLLHYRPVPFLARRTCPECSFLINMDLYRDCPNCGTGEDIVWILTARGQILGVYRTYRAASLYRASYAIDEYKGLDIEAWGVQK